MELGDIVQVISLPDEGEDFLQADCWFSGWGGELGGKEEGRYKERKREESLRGGN